MIEAGHHIYLGNVRGTKYSSSAVDGEFDPASFWDFTMTDMALDYKAFA
jgi:hypothetical protein